MRCYSLSLDVLGQGKDGCSAVGGHGWGVGRAAFLLVKRT